MLSCPPVLMLLHSSSADAAAASLRLYRSSRSCRIFAAVLIKMQHMAACAIALSLHGSQTRRSNQSETKLVLSLMYAEDIVRVCRYRLLCDHDTQMIMIF